jgi:toxin FitB
MIILDTDVISTLMRLHRDPVLAQWLNTQTRDQLMTTAPTVFEITVGIEMKPTGQKRSALETAFHHVLVSILGNRVAPLDLVCSASAGQMRARQLASGRNVSIVDSQIAGIAANVGATLATRNVRDFSRLGLQIIDPWTASP